MIKSLLQFERDGHRGVAAITKEGLVRVVTGVETNLELAKQALGQQISISNLAETRMEDALDLKTVRLLCPIDHADPAHLMVSGTGLTHLGSAEGRDQMHAQAAEATTDSMRMFKMGLEGGKPQPGEIGVQPEWFYKGDGSILVNPDEPVILPGFAADGGEEPEIAGIYVIDERGEPVRLGFALGNEFSDHVTEKENYLWLAHSKLRQAALGPELLLGDLPVDIKGKCRIRRQGETIWEKSFLSGEINMSHSISNLEHHHFKYQQFRRPGSAHVHFFGTATLSFTDGVNPQPGDEFEVAADAFQFACRNPLLAGPPETLAKVRSL